MNKRGSKSGQIMSLPFGMIFSIILIIAFIVVAFYAISVFLSLKKCAETGIFKQDLQEDIDRAWNSPETSISRQYNLPSNIEHVCFVDIENSMKGKDKEKYNELVMYEGNMVFYPPKKACQGQRSFEINHVNITQITKQNNPYCIKNPVSLNIEKGFYDATVIIS